MKKKLLALMLLLPFIVLSGCDGTRFTNPSPDECTWNDEAEVYVCEKIWIGYFDAPISLKLYYGRDDAVDLEKLYDEVEAMLSEYHEYFDRYNSYNNIVNVYSINQSGTSGIVVSERLFDAIAFGLGHENDITVNGALLFDIALGPVLSIWHDARESDSCVVGSFASTCDVPSELIDGISFNTDPSDIDMDRDNLTITFLKPNMSIDLGGYGKGYVSEIITDYLDSLDLDYIFNAGESNLKAGGTNPTRDNGVFYIGLKKPEVDALSVDFYAYLKITAGISVVTSGNYQRYFLGSEDGEIYHHIIDPRTNYPGGEAMSVTIFYEDGALADIYSTAIFLMTVEEGITYVDETEGLEAIWYLEDGTIMTSANFTDIYLYQYPDS